MATIQVAQICLEGWGIVLCLSMSACSYWRMKNVNVTRNLLFLLEVVTAFLLGVDLCIVLCSTYLPGNESAAITAKCGVVLARGIVIYVFAEFLKNKRETTQKRKVIERITELGIIAYVVIGMLYEISIRGGTGNEKTLEVLVYILYFALFISFGAQVLSRITLLSETILMGLSLYVAGPFIGEYLSYGTKIDYVRNLGYVLGLLFLFVCEEIEMSIQQADRERRIMKFNTDALLAQMQPHFLYNTLTSIQYHASEGNEETEKEIGEFSRYLRYNLDAMKAVKLTSFQNEIEHTNTYVNFEKLRFGERVQVEYELETQDFFLPMLTLQPMVERAITHGITKKKSGGLVTVTTRERPDGKIQIEVADNGEGKSDPITGCDNQLQEGYQGVKARIEQMCGGEMNLISRKGEGTVVTIVIPHFKEN